MWKCLHDDPGTSKLLKQIYGASRPDIAYPKVRALVQRYDTHYRQYTPGRYGRDELTPPGTHTGAQASVESPAKAHDSICIVQGLHSYSSTAVRVRMLQHLDVLSRYHVCMHSSIPLRAEGGGYLRAGPSDTLFYGIHSLQVLVLY